MPRARVLWVVPLAAAVFFLNAQTTPAANAYVDGKLCAGCHAQIAQTYARTGMGRSFYRAQPASMVEDFTRGNPFLCNRAFGRRFRSAKIRVQLEKAA